MRREYRVVIVEDEAVYSDALKDMLVRYEKDQNVSFNITTYRNVESFLAEYKNCYDIVFMDIELPGMNGMDGARRLRQIDPVVVLIFITNMAQFAVQGYEVNALDYILKPVTYKNFSLKLERAMNCINKNADKYIVVNGKNGITRMNTSDIIYIEVRGHHLFFHLSGKKEVDVCGALGKLSEELREFGFAQCNSCFLLNMKYIDVINAMSVVMTDGTELQISKRKRKDFLNEFSAYVGKNGGGR
ncbi:MAG: LytTR family DNA-binding domain-containing protein [Clostridia bacterium]|nr:LytTR family DNA-binding domain-containing protein [Clostridia bacterium]